MRSIVNISLPQSMLDEINQAVDDGMFASKSEFFRKLVRDWMEINAARELKHAHDDIAKGNGTVFKSIKDLY